MVRSQSLVCLRPKAFSFQSPLATLLQVQREPWRHIAWSPTSQQIMSVHLLQETRHFIRATVQFTPLHLLGSGCWSPFHRYACATETFSTPIKIKLGCSSMFGAHLGLFPFQLSINTNTFQMANIIGVGCKRRKKKELKIFSKHADKDILRTCYVVTQTVRI